MTLGNLKTKLIVVSGTNIGEVFFDWKDYLNETRNKTYPIILWQLDGARFENDIRTATIQKIKIITITVFAIASFDIERADKITVWDTLETYFNVYMNAINATAGLQIFNINEIKGQYAGEGLDADKEIGIVYTDVILKVSC